MKRFSYSKFEDTRKYNEEYCRLDYISKEMECPYHNPCSFSDDYLAANRDDRQIILCAVKKDTCRIEFASKALRADKEIISAALRPEPEGYDDWSTNLSYACKRLKNNKEIVLAAVKTNGMNLEYASKKLKADKEVVLAAVNNNGLALEYANVEICADRNIIFEAVRQNGSALQYANLASLGNDIFSQATDKQKHIEKSQKIAKKDLIIPDYKSDQDIVLAAVSSTFAALGIAGKRFKNNKEVMLAAVNQDGFALRYASDQLKADKEVVLAAVNNYGLALEYASDQLKADKEVVLVAVNNDGSSLYWASYGLKFDKEVFLAAVYRDPWAIHLADEDIFIAHTKSDTKIIAKIYFTYTNHINLTHPDEFVLDKFEYLFKHDKEFVVHLADCYKDHEIFLTTTHDDSDNYNPLR